MSLLRRIAEAREKQDVGVGLPADHFDFSHCDVFVRSGQTCPQCGQPLTLIDHKGTGSHVACVRCYRFWHLRQWDEKVNCTCFLPTLGALSA